MLLTRPESTIDGFLVNCYKYCRKIYIHKGTDLCIIMLFITTHTKASTSHSIKRVSHYHICHVTDGTPASGSGRTLYKSAPLLGNWKTVEKTLVLQEYYGGMGRGVAWISCPCNSFKLLHLFKKLKHVTAKTKIE